MPGTQTHAAEHLDLRRALNPWQIGLLALSGIIGVTIFSIVGELLNTAAVAGLLIALIIVSLTAIFVMECLSEFVVLWPVPNALVEYVKRFVDEDLGIVVGIAYWYTWSSIFSVLLLSAYDFFCLFVHTDQWRVFIFVAIAFTLLAINAAGIKVYGHIEAIGGLVKWLNAIAGGIFLWVVVGKDGSKNGHTAFGYQKWEADDAFSAICMSIPILAYGFLGVEIVAVTAFEAEKRESLRDPSRLIAWVMAATYFFCALPGAMAVSWNDHLLQQLVPLSTPTLNHLKRASAPEPASECQKYYPLIVLAAFEYGSKAAAKYFNACICYFCISASNTALYVASRTLYGLVREERQYSGHGLPWRQQILQSPRLLGRVSAGNRVPVWALITSAASFAWLPALRSKSSSVSATEVLEVMATIGSVGGMLVWAAECLAYIKYYSWLRKWKDQLGEHYDRWAPPTYKWQRKRPLLSAYQPAIAWIGLIACLLIVFVLNSAFWWNGKATAAKVLSAYTGPFLLLIIFAGLKIWRRFSPDHERISCSELEIGSILENLSGLQLREEIPLQHLSETNGHATASREH